MEIDEAHDLELEFRDYGTLFLERLQRFADGRTERR